MTGKQFSTLSPQERLQLIGPPTHVLYMNIAGTEQIGIFSGNTEPGIYWQQGPHFKEEWFRTMALTLRRMADVMEGKVSFEVFGAPSEQRSKF